MTEQQVDDSELATLEVVLFRAGGCLCAVVASQVGAMSAVDEGGDAMPIEEMFGLESAPAAGLVRKKLELKPANDAAGLHQDPINVLITPPVDLLRLAVVDIHPLPPLLAVHKSLRWLRALAVLREQERSSLVLLFNVPDTHNNEESLAVEAVESVS